MCTQYWLRFGRLTLQRCILRKTERREIIYFKLYTEKQKQRSDIVHTLINNVTNHHIRTRNYETFTKV